MPYRLDFKKNQQYWAQIELTISEIDWLVKVFIYIIKFKQFLLSIPNPLNCRYPIQYQTKPHKKQLKTYFKFKGDISSKTVESLVPFSSKWYNLPN